MLLATVVGTATATVKHASLHGWRLLVTQPLLSDGARPDGHPLLAIDNLGAGVGDRVLLTSDGRGTREMVGSDTTPVRWSVMGIVD